MHAFICEKADKYCHNHNEREGHTKFPRRHKLLKPKYYLFSANWIIQEHLPQHRGRGLRPGRTEHPDQGLHV